MKTVITVSAMILLIIACGSKDKNIVTDEKTGKKILVGKVKRSHFEIPEFVDSFWQEYENYQPESVIIEKIKQNDVFQIEIYFGTWCKDSRRELPRFFKILDAANIDQGRVSLIGLNRKKVSPRKLEKNKNIELVPTFIIYSNETEIGRIIEFPIVTLEQDLFDIIENN
jgi:thiol-disulfide isomerase/thioredoxin